MKLTEKELQLKEVFCKTLSLCINYTTILRNSNFKGLYSIRDYLLSLQYLQAETEYLKQIVRF